MQIYFVERTYRDRWVMDEDRGLAKRRELIMQPSGIDRIVHEGKTYEVGDDMTFDLPDDVGRAILKMRPDAQEGVNPFAAEAENAPDPVVPRPRRTAKARA